MKRYYITTPQHDEIKKRDFSCDTFTNGKQKYKCYSDTILYLLSDSPEMQNMETKQVEKLEKNDINHFLNIYGSAFNRGVDQFNSDYKIDASVLYSNNADAFVKTLIEKYNEPYTGWKWLSEMFECVVTDTNIEKIGHASGSRSALKELVNNHKAIFEKYEKETDNFDSDETTSPKQKGEKMKLELLDNLFIPAMTAGAKPTKLDHLKEDLRRSVSTSKGKEVTALADVIYKSGLIHKNVKPKNFTDWLKQFCNIIDYPLPTYKQEQKAVKEEYSKMKNTYHYLIP